MRCPSCGALYEIGGNQCPECAAFASRSAAEESEVDTTARLAADAEPMVPVDTLAPDSVPQTSRLIEFPGVSRSAMPEWRKELSERVREVQEKRAREAGLEAPDTAEPTCSQPQLELLPQVEPVPVNPLVAAALRRIERAHQAEEHEINHHQPYALAAVAYATDTQFLEDAHHRFDALEVFEPAEVELCSISDEAGAPPERVHNLVVVPPVIDETTVSSKTGLTSEAPFKSKPRRLIADNDPALNYLDRVPTSVRVEVATYRTAPRFSRFLGAIVDVLVVGFLCTPFAAVVELTNRNWLDFNVIGVAAIVFSTVSFLYFTISTALTGRTLGTRLFSLRIVDARTGLIPTGKQSAGRALVYLATLLTLGLVSAYALIDREQRTPHDRLTGTAVIAV